MSNRKNGTCAVAFALLSGMGGALVQTAAADPAEGAPATPASPGAAPAQPASPRNESAHLETVIVTGTNLPTSPDAVAVPVVTLDADQLQQNGVTSNPLEVLRKAIPSFAGRSNAGSSNANNNNQNTAGGSQLQLRNLPTLVLINGRRVATSGIGAVNGKNFVDVNQIPAAAIDHVDVLTDGASSIYGSDAIGGVVNFVLKSNYEGLEIGGRGAGADGYGERSGYLLGGKGWNSGQFTAAASFSQTDPLFQNQRSFTSPLYGKTSSIPGVVTGSPTAILAPGLYSPSQTNPTGTAATAASMNDLIANGTYLATTPAAIANGFDVSPYQQLLLKQEQDSFFGTVAQQIFGKKLEFFGDALVSRSRSSTKFLPVAMTGISVAQDAPFNPVAGKVTGVTFSDLDRPHQFLNDVTAWRITAGLRGQITHDWNWETGLVYSQSDLEQQQTNLIYKPNLALAIAGGYDANGNPVTGGGYSLVYGGFSKTGTPSVLQPALDPFARSAGLTSAMLANLYGTEVINATSRLASFDAKIAGNLFELPAGKVGAAFGGGVRREELSGHTDPNGRVTDPTTGSVSGNDQNWQGGTFADPFSKGRNIDAVFTEVRVPITGPKWNVPGLYAFDLTGAVRAEKYSDAGYSTVPKIGFRWEPMDKQFSLRGTYARSFTAPTLFSEYGPTDRRQVGAAVIQGVFGANYTGMPFNGEDGNNPGLQPAKSTSRTIGFTFKPKAVPGLSVSLDYSDIALSGFQGGIGFNNVLGSINALGAASPFFNNLSINAYPGDPGASNPFTNPGDLKAYLTDPATGKGDPSKANNLFAVDQFRNLGSLIERSFALSAEYVIPTDRYGTFTLATTGANFRSFQFIALPGQPSQELAGFATNSGVFGGTLPKYRFFNSFDWAYNNWDFTLGNTYVSSVTDIGPNGTSPPKHVDSYVTFDLRLAHDWHFDDLPHLKTVTAAIGVNNVTDEMPPLAPQAFSDNNADVATYSPIGRLVYGTLVLKF
jgi:iron complex outermembrane receptor protein